MRRIGLAVILAASLLAAPRAEAQSPAKVWRIGVFVAANPRLYDGFIDELRGLGYIDGQNIVLEFRNAEGKVERYPPLAAELVPAGVDVILASGSEGPLRAVRQATATIPNAASSHSHLSAP